METNSHSRGTSNIPTKIKNVFCKMPKSICIMCNKEYIGKKCFDCKSYVIVDDQDCHKNLAKLYNIKQVKSDRPK